MFIKILGSGCAKCNKLMDVTQKAVKEMGIDAHIEKVEDMAEIMAYGVMRTPALVVDEEVKTTGSVPSLKELKKYLS